jgi:prepilin-type N-terminal cleavage/methylation domain-containing protein
VAVTSKEKRGVTLSEVLACLAIVALLLAAIYPAVLAARGSVVRLQQLISDRHARHGVVEELDASPQVSAVAGDVPASHDAPLLP